MRQSQCQWVLDAALTQKKRDARSWVTKGGSGPGEGAGHAALHCAATISCIIFGEQTVTVMPKEHLTSVAVS